MKKIESQPQNQPNAKSATTRRELIYKSTAIGLLIGAFALFISPIVAFFQPVAVVAADETTADNKVTPVLDIFDGPQGTAGVSYWSFKEFPFRVQHSVVAENDLGETLFTIPEQVFAPQNDSSQELFQMITTTFSPLMSVGEIDFYGLKQPELQVAIAAHRETRSIVSGALAYPQKSGFFTVLRLLPVNENVGEKTDEHLLPMASDARTVCSGFAGDGSLTAEVVETETDLKSLIDDWQSEGWFVEQFQSENSDDLLIGCHKGDSHIAVARFKSSFVTGNAFLIRKVAMSEAE